MVRVLSNSPLSHPPADYCSAGSDAWFELTEGYDSGKRLFYSDFQTGENEQKQTVLFVHGNPENSYTFRHIRDELVASGGAFRLVAPDHIGFGLSDQADYEMVEMHHASNLLQLVRHLDLHDVILVVHDWGGPIGIGAMLKDPDRIAGLCVLNTSVFPMPEKGPTYTNYPFSWMPWHQTPNLVPNRLWGGIAATLVPSQFDPKNISAFLPAVMKGLWRYGRGRISPDVAEHVWSQPLSSVANAKSSKQLVRQTANWGSGLPYVDEKHGEQDNRAFYLELQSNLSRVWGPGGADIPISLHFGLWDAIAKESVIAQWHEALPLSREGTNLYEKTGHFVEEQKGPEIAAAIVGIAGRLAPNY